MNESNCVNGKKEKKIKLGFDRILFLILIISFLSLIISQTFLFVPKLRTTILLQDPAEGTPISQEEYLYNKGTLELKLLYLKDCPGLKILVNGDEVYNFIDNIIKLDIKDGDVLEIDRSDVIGDISITVTALTNNISSQYIEKNYQIENKVQKLFKISIPFQP
jgi:hypothetical protein